jgi:hypothetical protein
VAHGGVRQPGLDEPDARRSSGARLVARNFDRSKALSAFDAILTLANQSRRTATRRASSTWHLATNQLRIKR